MCNKDRSTDHKDQQASEANRDDSWAISLGSVGQTHSDRTSGWHSKTDWKPDTCEQNSQQQWSIKQHLHGKQFE